jgi:hypothetical protein
VLLSDVATRFLEHHGYEAHPTADEAEAKQRFDELTANGRWPLLLTPLNTSGEKPYEEFIGAHETVEASRFGALKQIAYLPPVAEGSFPTLIEMVAQLLASGDASEITIDSLLRLIAEVEPSFEKSHRASGQSLDERM